ncbi:ABC transporter ATP-binding protein [Natronomonas halophila]|uniref:ABC transporter ATP-binding protein n=1 Tax=Natronomonas halophila TaxID=2747817 RepID=UPI0015B50577|nr:ABC transporter ATP-binding protein [Natronomonas halophila]QLD87079.1 ABC transporter ATP-binding protein [Natronomonas halophila]
MDEHEVTVSDKINALKRVARYRPAFTVFIILFSAGAALLEAIGLTFLLPILEVAQRGPEAAQTADGVAGAFFSVYEALGIPYTLEFLLIGVATVMVVRYSSTFAAKWFSAKLHLGYEEYLKDEAFTRALEADVSYYDKEGSDEVLNAIITQTRFAGRVIKRVLHFFRQSLLALMYLTIALVLAPILTLLAAITLGGITLLIRYGIEPGYTVGDRVAEANERIQENVQAGTQGIRDVKLFQMDEEIRSGFRTYLRQYVNSNIDLVRNKAAIQSLYELTVAIMLFVLIYIAVEVLALSFGALGLFLFAMFRLAPRVSNLNSQFYNIEGDLPHLVRTHWFIENIENYEDIDTGDRPVPDPIERVAFEDVSFSYETGEEKVLENISFEVEQGEFVAFVGQSGAGKSTIVSLLARLYDPDSGRIVVNQTSLEEIDLGEWRQEIAMVRQDPHIFNESLRFNMSIGNRDASREELDRVAEISKVDEFLDDLPKGYDTALGDEGVQLSGGQRQRVSLARALLTDAEFLVLDEATSDLDTHLERQIHEAIESLEDDYTILAIAHRLSTVQNADRIYTIDSGEITEIGTHDELVSRDGMYAELYTAQS